MTVAENVLHSCRRSGTYLELNQKFLKLIQGKQSNAGPRHFKIGPSPAY